MRTINELLREVPATLDKGLSSQAVTESARRYGVNRLTQLPRESLWLKFLAKFDEPIIKILLAAALLSMIVDLVQREPALGGFGFGLITLAVIGLFVAGRGQWIPSIMFIGAFVLFFLGLASGHLLVEGLAVMIAVILATGVAFASEFKSDREFELLNTQKDSLSAKVLRDGSCRTIALEEVVVGDLILLEMGDEIPADGRIVKATELHIDQSLMTGESEPSRKHVARQDDDSHSPDNRGCVYRGTQVVDGAGQMLVAEVGDATALGQIAKSLADEETPDDTSHAGQRVKRKLTISKELTPLQQKLEKLAGLISKVGYVAAVLIFLAQLLHGILVGKVYWTTNPENAIHVFGVLLSYFVNMVIIIVVAVPEGLPMSVTVSLALAMRKMTRANSLVRQLVACETIGSATVICSDKTGTMTQNKMQVTRLCWNGQMLEHGTPQWPKLDVIPTQRAAGGPSGWIALNAAINSTANLEDKQGKLVTVGNSTEGALLLWLRDGGLEYRNLRSESELLYQLHFSSERKRMTSVIRQNHRLISLAKGSPEWILDHTTHYLASDDSIRPWTPVVRQEVERQLKEAAAAAMRTLAFCHCVLPDDLPHNTDSLHAQQQVLESDLVFDGFVAIHDPLRHDVKEAVSQCQKAGIEVKMVTGDNAETARAIAFDVGLLERRDVQINDADGPVMTSDHFNSLNDEQLKNQLPRLRVLARARPLDKYRMVTLLQDLGEVVAVTGDGTNDAPALKKADVGLAMGIAGTEVAKEASKIVLLDDSFATIVKAVHWGRALYENIQRFLQFQLTINVSALVIYLLSTLFFHVEAPFTVLQLLWINVIMDTFAAIALCSEPPRFGLMSLPPKKRDDNIVSAAMLRTISITAAFFIIVMLAILVAMKGTPASPGWLGDQNGPWSVEVDGSRFAADPHDLVLQPNKTTGANSWHIRDKPSDTQFAAVMGREIEIEFTVRQVSIFFSVYVFFQVWNQINCRSLTPQVSGLRGLTRNPTFLAIASTIAIGQIIIVTFGGPVFKVEPLDPLTWAAIVAGTSSVLIFAEAARRAQLMMVKK